MDFFRASRFVRTAVSLGVALVLFLAAWPATGVSANEATVAAGRPLTNTALGGYSEVDQIDMLSPSLGYALATHSFASGRYAYYLVRTTDLATTWTIQSRRLFVTDYPPTFADNGAFDSAPPIDFVNRDEGYVAGPRGTIYMTDDAGKDWSRLPHSGSYGVSQSTVSVVSAQCRNPDTANYSCVNTLSEYRVGSTVPELTTLIPVSPSLSKWAALLAAAPGPIQVVNLDSDEISARTSLLITDDGGEQWRTLANPCAGQLIEQLAVAAYGEWLLSCILDEGMSQGPAKVFRSTNQGTTWHTVLNEARGTTIYYFFNGNDHVLFGAATNPAGGLGVSTDGGIKWTDVGTVGNTGGAPESVSNFGPTSSLYQVSQGPMYVTRDDRNWTELPPLPAGRYHDMTICTKHEVKVQMRRITSGHLHYAFVDFMNHSSKSCYLDGVPMMQPLNADGRNVGPAISPEVSSATGDFVVLKAHGGSADVPFQANHGYGRSSHCEAERASSVQIEFARTSVFRLSLQSSPVSVCTTFQSIFTTQVRSGIGHV